MTGQPKFGFGALDYAIGEAIEGRAREIAREEVASLAGLVLNRISEVSETDNAFELGATLRSIFAEALRDFGGTAAEPGEEDGA